MARKAGALVKNWTRLSALDWLREDRDDEEKILRKICSSISGSGASPDDMLNTFTTGRALFLPRSFVSFPLFSFLPVSVSSELPCSYLQDQTSQKALKTKFETLLK